MDIGHFASDRLPSDAEMRAFLGDDQGEGRSDDEDGGGGLPYVTACAVASLDNVISFAEPGDEGPTGIGLGHTHPMLSSIDLCVLRNSWARADAILISGSILRREPDLSLQTHCVGQRQPLIVVITTTADSLPYDTHPVFRDQHVIVAAPAHVVASMAHMCPPLPPPHVAVTLLPIQPQEQQAAPNFICLRTLLRQLRRDHGVRRLEVAAGGATLRQLIAARLLHELKLTQTLQVAGAFNSRLEVRSRLFGDDKDGGGAAAAAAREPGFTSATAPQMALRALRVCGPHMMFMRMKMQYK